MLATLPNQKIIPGDLPEHLKAIGLSPESPEAHAYLAGYLGSRALLQAVGQREFGEVDQPLIVKGRHTEVTVPGRLALVNFDPVAEQIYRHDIDVRNM